MEKACARCGITKHESEYYRQPRNKTGLHSWCKICVRMYVQKRRAEDPESVRSYFRNRYATDPAYQDRVKANVRKAKAEKPEHYRNLDRSSKHVVRARAHGAAAIDRVDYGAIVERDGMNCGICGEMIINQSELSLDHIVPLSRGGEHVASNLQVAHRRCNSKKGNRTQLKEAS